MGVRSQLKGVVRGMKRWLDEGESPPALPALENRDARLDNTYDWLWLTFEKFMGDPVCSQRPQYIWGVLQGAILAKVLGIDRVSVLEFGVGGGGGLIALERIAERCEELANIQIEIFGFDTGVGHPKPKDYRDVPYKWSEGYYPCDKQELQKRLKRSHLKFGLLKDTLPEFLKNPGPPVAFAVIDLALYSSTTDALRLFEGAHSLFLPRIPFVFRCTVGKDYSDYTGERLAMSEFNTQHGLRRFSPIHGMKYFVPPRFVSFWTEMLYWLHIFDHPLYDRPDSFRQSAIMLADGHEIFLEAGADVKNSSGDRFVKPGSQ